MKTPREICERQTMQHGDNEQYCKGWNDALAWVME